MVSGWIETHGYSESRACRLMGMSRSSFQYQAQADRNERIRKRLRELAAQRPRFGSYRLWLLLRREGNLVNHKRVERIYRQEKLSLRGKTRRKRASRLRVPLPVPTEINRRWSMDFVSDLLESGHRIRCLTLVDDFSRESHGIYVDRAIPGIKVTEFLDRLGEQRGYPEVISIDNGPEFAGKVLDTWAHEHGIKLHFIEPGKPIQNAYIESFNGRFRDECLNQMIFINLEDAREKIEAWRVDYNQIRPHSSLGNMTPEEFVNQKQVMAMTS